MNDFTKDEWQIILLDMDTYILNSNPLTESPTHLELRNKIQSLIDNYCEHDGERISDSMMVNICAKCLRVL